MKALNKIQRAALGVKCPGCGAAAGKPCGTWQPDGETPIFCRVRHQKALRVGGTWRPASRSSVL